MRQTILPLEVQDLCFQARGVRLIKDISFSLKPGMRLMVLGANGAGKSLLLRLCHGLLIPSQGAIRWAGDKTFSAQTRSQQAMVFQRPVMLRRTALANIDYVLKKTDKQSGLAMEYLDRVGLAPLAKQPARLLSFGEQQRLALARAWALRPEVLLLDEPTASLDPSATHMIEDITRQIAQEGTTIMMTTHDLGQAKRLGSHVMFMHRGRVLEFSQADDFFACPQSELAQAFVRGELLWWEKKKDIYPGGGIDLPGN